MECEEVKRRLHALIEGGVLKKTEVVALIKHLEGCEACNEGHPFNERLGALWRTDPKKLWQETVEGFRKKL